MSQSGSEHLQVSKSGFVRIFELLVRRTASLWETRTAPEFPMRFRRSTLDVLALGWVCQRWRCWFLQATECWESKVVKCPVIAAALREATGWVAAKRIMVLLPLVQAVEHADYPNQAWLAVDMLRVSFVHPDIQEASINVATLSWTADDWACLGGISTQQYASNMDCVLGSFPAGFNYPYVTLVTIAAAHCTSSKLLGQLVDRVLPISQKRSRDLSHIRGALRCSIDASQDENSLFLMDLLESRGGAAVPCSVDHGWAWLFRRALQRQSSAVCARILKFHGDGFVCTLEDLQSSIATMDIAVTEAILRSILHASGTSNRNSPQNSNSALLGSHDKWWALWKECIVSDRVEALKFLLSLDEGSACFSDSDQEQAEAIDNAQNCEEGEGFRPVSSPQGWVCDSRAEMEKESRNCEDPLVEQAFQEAYKAFARSQRDSSALSSRSLLLACQAGASATVEFLLATTMYAKVCITTDAFIECVRGASPRVLEVLLHHAAREGSLGPHLMSGCADRKAGILHELCKSEKSIQDKEACFALLCKAVTSQRAVVVLNDLSWFDEHDHLPIDYTTGSLRDTMARLFPADALWNQLEIQPSMLLECTGFIDEKGGRSKAPIEKWSYIDASCEVAVKRYPKWQMQEIKRELGIMSRVRFPYVAQVLGWCALAKDNKDSIGVAMHAYACNLSSVLPQCSFDQKCLWMRQVGAALKYLHAQHPPITHGDIHAMNILLSSSPSENATAHAVLCDFNFSSIQGTTRIFQLTKLSLIAHLFRCSDCDDGRIDERDFPQANDWLLFAFLLFSMSSSWWDWRVASKCLDQQLLSIAEAERLLCIPSGALLLVKPFAFSHFSPRIQNHRDLGLLEASLANLAACSSMDQHCTAQSLPSTF